MIVALIGDSSFAGRGPSSGGHNHPTAHPPLAPLRSPGPRAERAIEMPDAMQEAQLRLLFDEFDADKSGAVSKEELAQMITSE